MRSSPKSWTRRRCCRAFARTESERSAINHDVAHRPHRRPASDSTRHRRRAMLALDVRCACGACTPTHIALAFVRSCGDERSCITNFSRVSCASIVLATQSPTTAFPCSSTPTSPCRTRRGHCASGRSTAPRRSAVATRNCTRRIDLPPMGGRSPRSPEDSERPRTPLRGRFRFSARKGKHSRTAGNGRISAIPDAPEASERKGDRPMRRISAVLRCFGTGRA